jgi:hypothetical protein
MPLSTLPILSRRSQLEESEFASDFAAYESYREEDSGQKAAFVRIPPYITSARRVFIPAHSSKGEQEGGELGRCSLANLDPTF